MKQEKITRKQFLLSVLSVATLVAIGNIPSIIKKIAVFKKNGNTYGNYSYGGSKKSV